MKMLDEFKKFILRGNVVDLSTGVIIGAAFTSIVTAFTKGIVEPILALFGSGPSTDSLKIQISEKEVDVTKTVDGKEITETILQPVELDIGSLIGAGFNFVITAAVVFFVIIKPLNALIELTKKKEEKKPAAPAEPPADVKLLTEIRDLLKKDA